MSGYIFNENFYQSKDDCMDAIMSAHPTALDDNLPEFFDMVVTDYDMDNCDHPENMREYDSRLATMATMYDPAEYWEWYTCELCGEREEL